jgi:hypothetical protein
VLGEDFGEEKTFTTEAAAQVGNSSFDSWYKDDKTWYANVDLTPANYWWDSGNKATNILGEKNPTSPEESVVIRGKSVKLASTAMIGVLAAGSIYTGKFKEIIGIGAKLSFAAIIGILGIFPTIEESEKIILSKIKCNKAIKSIVKRILDIIGISISCQIATLPLTLFYFGGYAHYFIIANLIAIPLTTAILYILIAAILTMPINFINGYLCTSLSYVIRLMNSLVEYLS